jgi:hypothetical protein
MTAQNNGLLITAYPTSVVTSGDTKTSVYIIIPHYLGKNFKIFNFFCVDFDVPRREAAHVYKKYLPLVEGEILIVGGYLAGRYIGTNSAPLGRVSRRVGSGIKKDGIAVLFYGAREGAALPLNEFDFVF